LYPRLKKSRQAILIWLLIMTGLLTGGGGRVSRVVSAQRDANEIYRGLPMVFEANQGQVGPEVRYLARGHGYQVFLTEDEVVLVLSGGGKARSVRGAGTGGGEVGEVELKGAPEEGVLRFRLETEVASHGEAGGAGRRELLGVEPLAGRSNYLIGNDPNGWQRDIPHFGRVEYREVYPGVSMALYGRQQSLEYDWIVGQGADPSRISLAIEGAERIDLDPQGDLVLTVAGGRVYHRSPKIYQQYGRERRPVAGRYVLQSGGRIGFDVESYDRSRPLIIDPVIDYSTFIGGVGSDEGLAIAVDSQRNTYVTGTTYSNNFNVLTPLQTSNRGGKYDAFVTKIDPTGAGVVWSTYLGGSSEDEGRGIAVNAAGQVYVAGITNSPDFNTRNPWQPALVGLAEDAFIAKIDATGSSLIFSTYLGGSDIDQAFAIALDSSGNAYVTGSTNSADFRLKNSIQSQFRGNYDAFLAKIRADGTDLIYSTYLGGGGFDEAYGVAVDLAGNAYVTGVATSTDFPVVGALQAQNRGGGGDLFVTKVSATGNAISWSTYLGGTGVDIAYGIALDTAANVYLTGHTFSSDYPTVGALQGVARGGAEAFLTKLGASGSAVIYSTYLGGSGGDFGRGVAVDTAGYAVVTGRTISTDFNTFNPLQATSRGEFDAFVARVTPAGNQFVYSTYLGGTAEDLGYGVAVDSAGNAYVTGDTYSTNFPTKSPLQQSNRGGFDAFVARIASSGTTLEYSTYLGGSGEDLGVSIAVDTAGSAYITGYTSSNDFPTRNPLQPNSRGGLEVFVTKVFADASEIAFNTYLGGNGSDTGNGIAVDQGGNIFLAGTTASTNFPTRNPIQPTNQGGLDLFVAKINATGSNLVYATYLGGSSGDLGRGIAVDGSGNVFVAGSSFSTNFPVQGAFQATSRGSGDAVVVRLSSSGTSILQSSYLGGSGVDEASGVAVDRLGNGYVIGTTGSTDFNLRTPLQAVNQGQQDAFVVKVAASGGGLIYSTYLGGSLNDVGNGITVDGDGNALVTGATASNDFPRQQPFQSVYGGGDFDAFLVKINGSGSGLIYSTYLGGRQTDIGNSVSVEPGGTIYVAGITSSTNFPVANPLQAENRGGNDAFVSRMSADGARLIFSSYLGGSGDDRGYGVATDPQGVAYLVGATSSSDFNVQFPLASYGGGTDTFVAKLISNAAISVAPAALEVQIGKVASLALSLNTPAATPTIIALSSSNPAVARVPATVTIPVGEVTGTVAVTAVAAGGPVTITLSLPTDTGTASAMASVTVVSSTRFVQALPTNVAAGGFLTIPIDLQAQGNENRVSFSLSLDPVLFVTPQFVLGSDAGNGTLNTIYLEETRGRYGITIILPPGETFEAGLREVLLVQAVVAAGTGGTTATVSFIDQPTIRRIDDPSGFSVGSAYLHGIVTISQGYEGDVAPRPNGSNGTVTISDWVQTGRFAASLDTPTAGSEFQRADTAPRSTLGNGAITVSDWVQTGRYAAALDPVLPAGGPVALAITRQASTAVERNQTLAGMAGMARVARSSGAMELRLRAPNGQPAIEVSVEYRATGGENGFGFSLQFDPALATFGGVKTQDGQDDGVIQLNTTQLGEGRIGIALVHAIGRELSPGRHRLLTLILNRKGKPRVAPAVSFADYPVRRELVTVRAEPVDSRWEKATVTPLPGRYTLPKRQGAR
jgi:hypothetical protein